MISNICLSCGDDLDWPSGDGCANMTAHKNDNKPWENLVTDELVKRLRDWPRQGATKSTNLLGDAADRIEALTAERDRLLKLLNAIVDEYNGQVHGPILYSINDALVALKGESHE